MRLVFRHGHRHGRRDVRGKGGEEVREARIREPPIVVLFRKAHRHQEACASGAGERGEWGVGEAIGREDERGNEVLAAVDGGG